MVQYLNVARLRVFRSNEDILGVSVLTQLPCERLPGGNPECVFLGFVLHHQFLQLLPSLRSATGKVTTAGDVEVMLWPYRRFGKRSVSKSGETWWWRHFHSAAFEGCLVDFLLVRDLIFFKEAPTLDVFLS